MEDSFGTVAYFIGSVAETLFSTEYIFGYVEYLMKSCFQNLNTTDYWPVTSY